MSLGRLLVGVGRVDAATAQERRLLFRQLAVRAQQQALLSEFVEIDDGLARKAMAGIDQERKAFGEQWSEVESPP
jgi:hypothetical protein